MSVHHLSRRSQVATGVRPLPSWHATVADLRSEAEYLADRLRQPLVRTAGTAGIVNRLSPSTVWVCSQVDLDELLRELDGADPAPEIMVPEHSREVAESLVARGRTRRVIERLHCDLTSGPPTTTGARWHGPSRPAHRDDLPRLRDIYRRAFPAIDPAALLPDEILRISGLQLLVTTPADAPEEIVGCVGVRLRHAGSLVFGLATEPLWQRRGVASALVGECLQWATERGSQFALADVDVPVRGLWARLGFVSSGRWHRCAVADEDCG